MIDAIDDKKLLQNASIIEVMKILVLAWAEVTPKTVKNCFKKAGFSKIKEDDGIHELSFCCIGRFNQAAWSLRRKVI